MVLPEAIFSCWCLNKQPTQSPGLQTPVADSHLLPRGVMGNKPLMMLRQHSDILVMSVRAGV